MPEFAPDTIKKTMSDACKKAQKMTNAYQRKTRKRFGEKRKDKRTAKEESRRYSEAIISGIEYAAVRIDDDGSAHTKRITDIKNECDECMSNILHVILDDAERHTHLEIAELNRHFDMSSARLSAALKDNLSQSTLNAIYNELAFECGEIVHRYDNLYSHTERAKTCLEQCQTSCELRIERYLAVFGSIIRKQVKSPYTNDDYKAYADLERFRQNAAENKESWNQKRLDYLAAIGIQSVI